MKFLSVYSVLNFYVLYTDKCKIKKDTSKRVFNFLMEAPPRFELGMRVLQTRALPLGYSAK